MPKKIKIVLTIVALVAVFLVYELAQYINTVANQNSTLQQGTSLPNPDDDPDHDGLSNQQEVIWGADPFNPDSDGDGFKDGEEVKSGHNPLIPGPNDLISADNLTEQFSQLAVAGLYSGDLNPDSQNYSKALVDITTSITDSGKYLFNKDETTSSLTVIPSSRESNVVYLNKISPLTRQFQELLVQEYENLIPKLNTIGAKGFIDPTVNKFFSSQALKFGDLIQEATNIPVTQDFKDTHINFIDLMKNMHDINDAIVHGDTDPVKASVALNTLPDVYNNYIDLMKNYWSIVNAKKINLNSSN